LATLTTNLTGSNNDSIITARNASYSNDPPIKIQYSILAPGAPAWLYEDGYPAQFIPATDLGFQLIMRKAGSWGNYYTLTLINPGRPAPLKIVRPALKDIVIRLAYAGSAVTTTPTLLIAAINSDPEISAYMMAFASSATVSVLPAVAKKSFQNGADVPGLVLVSLAAAVGAPTTPTTTGGIATNLLNGSRYVSAVNQGATTTGAVTVMPATALTSTAGTANRGDISEQYLNRRDAWKQKVAPGIPLGKEQNRTLQVRDSRFGAVRTYQRTSKQDRAVVTSSFQNHASDTLAAHTLG
jgi:hypothetical protein